MYNFEGWLRYDPTPEQNNEIMDTLYPLYNGETINKIKIKECIMLSIDNEKYNKMRNETIDILKQYNLQKFLLILDIQKKLFLNLNIINVWLRNGNVMN